MRYVCRYIDAEDGFFDWKDFEVNYLRDVVTGEKPRLKTRFRACWTRDSLHIRFECEDDHVVATMARRDDPIYLEDVVEIFVDTIGSGTVYYEFEVSPRNVVFDALIYNSLDGNKEVDVSWDAKGMYTEVFDEVDGWRIYNLRIPFADLELEQERMLKPHHGVEWRWNLYRIDDDPEGNRHYWAWSPTGKVDFHMPQRFGTLVFVKE
ncbi:Carbohydrate family 9 binding domain-like [Paenibacillus sp. yr247]|uniref:carbohydrate-binding family 9-like protein n=1 Tax=Paenibacillus sp. yr247 TaxID=1761880 RepID=UPI0008801C5D|nr:carbohydrate-binding family 9-like protein [Paenibacillus sp. yr247]SDN20316.1 Carbohydrate family 9 binding domain-like [Paenibacillus sp. yr247]